MAVAARRTRSCGQRQCAYEAPIAVRYPMISLVQEGWRHGYSQQFLRVAEIMTGTAYRRLRAPAISTGDTFLTHVAQETELGRTVKENLDAGQCVPDTATNAMVRELDDTPREVDTKLDQVLEIADTNELVRLLTRRALEQGRSHDTEDVIRPDRPTGAGLLRPRATAAGRRPR